MERIAYSLTANNLWGNSIKRYVDPILCRPLITAEELSEFCRISSPKLPRDIDEAYARQGQCYAFCRPSDPDYWYGGFVLNEKPAFRSLALYSEAYKYQLLDQHKLSENDMVEISCLWMNVHRIRPLERIWIYTQLLYKAYTTGKQAIIAFCFLPKLQAMQRQVLDQLLDEGTACVGRNGQEFMVQSYYTRRHRFIINVAKAFGRSLLLIGQKNLVVRRLKPYVFVRGYH